jgi:hypothetical protein
MLLHLKKKIKNELIEVGFDKLSARISLFFILHFQ